MSKHPNLFDKIALKLNPRYIYLGQSVTLVNRIHVGVIHKVPDSKTGWIVMDYLNIEKGTTMKYLGKASKYRLAGQVKPNYSVWELITPCQLFDYNNKIHHLSSGDIVCSHPSDRQNIYATPLSSLMPSASR